MKITKNDAEILWLTIGKVVAGSILMGVGFATALKGAMNWGNAELLATLWNTAPEECQKIADKLDKN